MSKNVPILADLIEEEKKGIVKKTDDFNMLVNQNPPSKWVKQHPYIKDYNYLPIDKVEFLLKRIFKRYKIEVTDQGQSFNGVWVTVRVHYLHPVTDEWGFHDGIGAIELQTKKGASPADMANINNGALGMAYPIAKSRAVKNACSEFGKLFGADLNREDTLEFTTDPNLEQKSELTDEEYEDLKRNVENGQMSPHKAIDLWRLTPKQCVELQEIAPEETDA